MSLFLFHYLNNLPSLKLWFPPHFSDFHTKNRKIMSSIANFSCFLSVKQILSLYFVFITLSILKLSHYIYFYSNYFSPCVSSALLVFFLKVFLLAIQARENESYWNSFFAINIISSLLLELNKNMKVSLYYFLITCNKIINPYNRILRIT